LLTKKHLNNANNASDNKNVLKKYKCNACDKIYNDRAGLWRHSKKCISSELNHNQTYVDKDDLILTLLKQNAELIKGQQKMIKSQHDVTIEILKHNVSNTNSNNTITNSHNKSFNQKFFLNDVCKNAMNITEFVDSIKLQLNDFMDIGKVGYVQGISNIIVKNLNSLDETLRPIHCTDQKRETFYVKDENIWEKEEDDKKKLKKMIKNITFKNEKLIKTYKDVYPDYNDPESKRSDQYSKTIIEALGGVGDNDRIKQEKIIKNISKVTVIKNKKPN
jgi:hypothetical protein